MSPITALRVTGLNDCPSEVGCSEPHDSGRSVISTNCSPSILATSFNGKRATGLLAGEHVVGMAVAMGTATEAAPLA